MQNTQNDNHGDNGGSGLVNIVSYSFKGNHLVEASLVREGAARTENQQKWGQPLFVFLKLLPGGKGGGGERTYISDKQVTMKLALHQLLELADALREYSFQRGAAFGRAFRIFTDSSKANIESARGGTKSVSVYEANAKGDGIKLMLNFSLKPGGGGQGENHSFSMTTAQARAMAQVFTRIAQEGLDLEIKRQSGENGEGDASLEASRHIFRAVSHMTKVTERLEAMVRSMAAGRQNAAFGGRPQGESQVPGPQGVS